MPHTPHISDESPERPTIASSVGGAGRDVAELVVSPRSRLGNLQLGHSSRLNKEYVGAIAAVGRPAYRGGLCATRRPWDDAAGGGWVGDVLGSTVGSEELASHGHNPLRDAPVGQVRCNNLAKIRDAHPSKL